MADVRNLLVTGLAAFAGGVVAGILFAPDSGARTRARIAEEARAQARNLEKKLSGLESKIDDLQKQVRETGTHLGERVVEAARHAAAPVPDDPEAFHVEKGDVAQDLRRMPRS